MKDYTVIGYYEDNSQVLVELTQAKDAEMAVAFAVCQIGQRTGEIKADIDAATLIAAKATDFLEFSKRIMILDVFEGHHQGELESGFVFSAYDHPEIGGNGIYREEQEDF